MKKIAWLVMAAALAVSPAAAATKKKAKSMDEAAAQRDAGWRLVRDASPLLLPSWAQVIYFSYNKDTKKNKTAKK
jgi:ABC-type Fe3+ transport system permease subunit